MKLSIRIVALFILLGFVPIDAGTLNEEIKYYEEFVKENPKQLEAMNRLAYLYTQKVRQTADFSYNLLAEKLVHQILQIQSKNNDALLSLSIIYMAQHNFIAARDSALKAISANANNPGALGILGDAYFELGDYHQCAKAYQKMGSLWPSAPYYARVAALRVVEGDREKGLELMKEALQSTNPRNIEDRSWYSMQLGNFYFDSGKTLEAEKYFKTAVHLNPISYNAWAGLAKVSVAQNKPADAIKFYEKAIAIVPMPDFAASLGDLYGSLGRKAEAEKQYSLVAVIGLLSKVNQEAYNRQLALFYADHDRNLDEALKLVQSEIAVRKDIYGYDALAWCLYKKGKIPESVKAMQQALRMGTKDVKLFYHAGIIYSAAGRIAEGNEFLRKALKIQPNFPPLYATVAHRIANSRNSK
jgi:tetratricopeptide (TPR) repeat protein